MSRLTLDFIKNLQNLNILFLQFYNLLLQPLILTPELMQIRRILKLSKFLGIFKNKIINFLNKLRPDLHQILSHLLPPLMKIIC